MHSDLQRVKNDFRRAFRDILAETLYVELDRFL